jgi:hypothetical protein
MRNRARERPRSSEPATGAARRSDSGHAFTHKYLSFEKLASVKPLGSEVR